MSYRIAILGGGQLARMSAYAAYRLGFEVGIVARPTDDSPALKLATQGFVGDWRDHALLKEVAEFSHVITLENEFIEPEVLSYLETFPHAAIAPSAKTIGLIQDKFTQKTILKNAGLPVPRFLTVDSPEAVCEAGRTLGFPMVLKCRTNGYDGYGNELIRSDVDAAPAFQKLTKRGSSLMVEEFVPFTKELAIMAVRNARGETATYPVVETIQHAHICHSVLAPADISEKSRDRATEIAHEVLKAVDGVGIYGIEMFLLTDGDVLINEIAPRPHNSGHYTIEACETSQFENHIRAVLNLPLGSTAMRAPAAVMVNILGSFDAIAKAHGLEQALAVPNTTVHLYGKEKSRPGRKMGHVTALGSSLVETRERAMQAARAVAI